MSAIHPNSFTEALFKEVQALSWQRYYLRVETLGYSDDKTERSYVLVDKLSGKAACTFRARPLPGCCGVLVVYYLRPAVSSNISFFKKTLRLIEKAAGRARYGCVLLTQTDASAGYTAMDSAPQWAFVNWKTNNGVGVFLRAVGKTAPKPAPDFNGE